MGNEPAPWTMSHDGDSAVVIAFESRIDPVINARCVAVANRVRAARMTGVRDVVESYHTVTVYLDPLRITADAVTAAVERVARQRMGSADDESPPSRLRSLPVCYGDRFGPDLADVAAFGRCSNGEVVRRHTGAVYRVYMLGFLPGFAYLGVVDDRIAAPRRDTPRLKVPVGSVGIAGPQTGIYPRESPGGWQIIGRCPVPLGDWSRAEPFLLAPGDSVRFDPIDPATYERLRVARR